MRSVFKTLVVIVAAVVALGLGGQAYAFHDGGVAECTGCHSMHEAEGVHLLQGQDQSSTCLGCHESASDTGPRSYHVSTAASALSAQTDVVLQRGPAGDFGWLRQNFSESNGHGTTVNNGSDRGHNIIAADNSYTVDPNNPTAPGGTMPANQLGCQSCHDPHSGARIGSDGAIHYPVLGATHDPILGSGSYGDIPAAGEAVGVYRLLGGANYTAWGSVDFPGNPAAVAPSSYNRTEAATPTRVAYGYGMTNGYTSWGKWCATCHPGMHTDSPGSGSGEVHKVDDTLGATIAGNYNYYVKTGDLSGDSTTSFTSLVPFVTPSTDIATLAALSGTSGTGVVAEGPSASNRISCLTCHRAHASGWKYALRWNGESEFLTLGDPATPIYPGSESYSDEGTINQGYTTTQMEAAYYDRPANLEFAGHQRSLCNKCHIKD